MSGNNINTTFIPTDTYFTLQWHLRNTGQSGGTAGIDINVTSIWNEYKGAGVKVAIIDDGFDLTHTDLSANFDTANDYDFRRNDTTPMYEAGDAHGTTVAGVIAADDNGTGMVGVAPDASLVGLRVSFSSDSTLTMFENAMFAARNFDVVNNSWGFTGYFSDNFTQGYMARMEQAVYDAASLGRGGLGTNIVFAAGNSRSAGDNVNYHNMQNSIFTIAVGAIDKTGNSASFSTPGAAVLVSAPGVGVYTTDNTGSAGYVAGDYVGISGTSFAAPIVSGVIALMLEANASLGYRDVQEILAYSARQIDKTNTGWQINGATNWNGQGLHFSHQYGFGLVDAHTAVRLAETWGTGTGTLATMDEVTATNLTVKTIPDGTSFASSTITITNDITVDHVEIAMNISHSNASQLDVILVSPHGTESLLLDNAPITGGLPSFTFSTVANWGERSLGDWTIKVYDRQTGTAGTLLGWAINISGDTYTNNNSYIFTNEFASLGTATYTVNDTNNGIDTFNAAALTGSVILDLTARTGSIGGRNIALSASTSLDVIYTGDGIDAVTGDSGNNTIYTGHGDDYVFASTGIDKIYGGAGLDTYFFTGFTNQLLTVHHAAHITISSTLTTDSADIYDFEYYQIGSDIYNLASLIALYETPVSTALNGTNLGDRINGTASNDIINGYDGNDYIYAKSGDDIVYGGAGDDRLYGDAGNDTLYGESGLDRIYGGSGNDTIFGGDDNDYIYGDAGNDILHGDTGNDYIRGGIDNDTIYGGMGNDRLYGDEGNDTIYGVDGTNRLYGGAGDDIIHGGLGADHIYGEAGNDIMIGGAGLDKFYLGTGNDIVILDTYDTSMERIYDFSLTGADADRLDISNLLEGYNSTTDAIANFLRLTISGSDTVIRINADGIGKDFVSVARIYGATFTGTAQNYIDSGVLSVEKLTNEI